jgi:MFS family permease
VLIGALTLDMFGVLFGGAVALLPVFADQVLHIGPEALGILRSAPAFGAVCMAVVLAFNPPVIRSGMKLLVSVALFGLSIFCFALSTHYWLSFGLLFLSGAFDNISVVIRSTIIQLYTPNHMRGRVASINSIFIGSSNEIGAFESGLTAKLCGTKAAMVVGSSLTLLVVAVTVKISPKLRKLNLKDLE